jgi:hypothetical protein
MNYRELTEKIIGCAYNVYSRMGYGFLEKELDPENPVNPVKKNL